MGPVVKKVELIDKLNQIAVIEDDRRLSGFRVLTRDALAGRLAAMPLGTYGVVGSVLNAAMDIKDFLEPQKPNVLYAPPKTPKY